MHFYFTRHGQTFWNVSNQICGATDIGLTDEGYQQAQACARLIAKEYPDINLILTSPLSRAYETARVISAYTGIPIMVEERLKEQNFGIFESTPRDSKEFHEAKMNFCDRFGTGESMIQVGARIFSLLDDLYQDTDHTILLVAHNGIARHIEAYFHSMNNEEFSSFGIRNCEVRRYDFPIEKD